MNKNCLICGKSFYVKPGSLKTGRGKYCSPLCHGKAMQGKKLPKKHRENIIKSLIGRKHTEETKRKIKESHKKIDHGWLAKYREDPKIRKKAKKTYNERFGGEKHPWWKGDKVKIDGIHAWVRKHNKIPKKCPNCKKEKKLDLAKRKGKEYTRNIRDYLWLCRKCHNPYDDIPTKVWKTRRRNEKCKK